MGFFVGSVVLSLGTNLVSLQSQRRVAEAGSRVESSYEKLASGQRINRASDDAAGLSIADTLNAHARVFTQAAKNLNDGQSYFSIVQGALSELSNLSIRQLELAEQAANGVYSLTQRTAIQAELHALNDEYNRIIQSTSFNGLSPLLSNSHVQLQLGFGAQGVLNLSVGDSLARDVGNGTFAATSIGAGLAITVDFDGDGDNDIISVSGSTASLRRNDGSGNFAAPVNSSVLTNANYLSFDVDKDGIMDLVGSRAADADLVYFRGNSSGTFSTAQTVANLAAQAPGNSDYLSKGDLNGDGYEDLIIHSRNATATSVLFNTGSGFIESYSLNQVAGSTTWTLGDVDNDGDIDLLAPVGLLRKNDGTGQFSAAISVFNLSAAGGNPSGGQLVDLNHDGFLDYIGSHGADNQSGTGRIFVALGRGDGTFHSIQTTLISSTAYRSSSGLYVADLNNDGHLDAVTNDSVGSRRFVAYGDGVGGFSSVVSTAATTDIWTQFNDINGDGVIDPVANGFLFNQSTSQSTQIATLDVLSAANARQALTILNAQLERISTELGIVGAHQARIQIAIGDLFTKRENYLSSESRIRDVDVAQESSNLVKDSILQQVAISALAQANLAPRLALQLLQG